MTQGYTEAQTEDMAEARFGELGREKPTMEEIFQPKKIRTLEELRTLTAPPIR